MRAGDKGKIALIISLFVAWQKESIRLAKKENGYGATGYTIGKFIGEWVATIADVDGQASVKTFKNQLEAMNRVSRKYNIKTIESTTMLLRLDKELVKNVKAVQTVKSVRLNRDDREKVASVLRKNGFTDNQVASIMMFGVLGNK